MVIEGKKMHLVSMLLEAITDTPYEAVCILVSLIVEFNDASTNTLPREDLGKLIANMIENCQEANECESTNTPDLDTLIGLIGEPSVKN